MNRSLAWPIALCLLLCFAWGIAAQEQEPKYKELPNFHSVNTKLFRGGQPQKGGLQKLSDMTGDLQRIREYPKSGYQIEQEIPDEIWNAFEQLVAAGYNRHLIRK